MENQLEKITEKIQEINKKAEKIMDLGKTKEIDSEEFYKQNIPLINKTKDFLNESNSNLIKLNKKQEKAVEKMELDSISQNITEKNKIEESVIQIGRNISKLFETVTPTGFMTFLAKEILETFKEIDEKIKNFNKKVEEFEKKLIEKSFNKEIEIIKNFDTKKVKENGIFGLDEKVLDSIFKLNFLQEKLFKAKIIDENTFKMLKNNQFEELGKEIIEKTIPMVSLISSLIDFNKKTREIIESIADFVKDKSQQIGLPATQIIQNQLQDIDSEKAIKISRIISEFANKVPHPYAQAIAKGTGILKNELKSSTNSKQIEREI